MSSVFPQTAIDSTSLEPDALTQPRRRTAALALSLYAAWWLQNTSGYFRWVYALSLEREEEIREAAATMGKSPGAMMKQLPFAKHKNKAPVPDSVKAHARFFLLLDWGGSAVGQIVRKQMIRTMSDYGIRRELHGFLTQHLSDLCVQLDAHFRVYRYMLATDQPTICDVMFAAALEFILKDDPPKYEIQDGSFLNLERWLADVAQDEERYAAIVEELESGKSRKRFSAGTVKGGVLFPFGGKASSRETVKALSEDAAARREAQQRLMAVDEKERGGEAENSGRELVTAESKGDHQGLSTPPSSLAGALSSSKRKQQQQQQLLQREQQLLQRAAEEEEERQEAARQRAQTRVSNVPLPTSAAPRQPVPLKQLTSTDDVVPETLAGVLSLIQEVFPWLEAQRNSIEDRINILLETNTPMDSITLPDSPSLGEYAGARVPMAMKLPRLVAKAWEMEVENPTTNLGDLAGADQEMEVLPWNKKDHKKEQAEKLAAEIQARKRQQQQASGAAGDRELFATPDELDSSVGAVDRSSLNARQFPTAVLPCGTSMPHLYMAQFVAQECEKCDFATVPAPVTVQRSVGHVVPLSEDKLLELKSCISQLRLEDPWAIAPQFAERDDVEYVVFRRQKLEDKISGTAAVQ